MNLMFIMLTFFFSFHITKVTTYVIAGKYVGSLIG